MVYLEIDHLSFGFFSRSVTVLVPNSFDDICPNSEPWMYYSIVRTWKHNYGFRIYFRQALLSRFLVWKPNVWNRLQLWSNALFTSDCDHSVGILLCLTIAVTSRNYFIIKYSDEFVNFVFDEFVSVPKVEIIQQKDTKTNNKFWIFKISNEAQKKKKKLK